ncbi:MAG: hypothetical protein AB7F25_12280 [Deferribacterales bacterium]
MGAIRYSCFVLVFRDKKLVWKGGIKVSADDAAGAVKAAIRKAKSLHQGAYVHVPEKNNPRVL